MNFLIFLLLLVIFALLDPDPYPIGIRIRIRNPASKSTAWPVPGGGWRGGGGGWSGEVSTEHLSGQRRGQQGQSLSDSLLEIISSLLASWVHDTCVKGLRRQLIFFFQCWGSVTFWCGSGSEYPYLWLLDPDPTPDPTPFSETLRMQKKNIFPHTYLLLITYPQAPYLQS